MNYVRDNEGLTTIFKNKDIDRAIKGTAKIEIFENNNLVLEAETENLLHNKAIYNMFYKQFLLQNFDIMNDTPLFKEGNIFQNMVIVNTNEPENANLEYIKGDIVGFCNLKEQVQSANYKEGILLPLSSSFIDKRYSFSAEFGVSKANGTFNTVFLTTPYDISSTLNGDGVYMCARSVAKVKDIPPNLKFNIKNTMYAFENNTLKPYKFYRDIDGNFCFRYTNNDIPFNIDEFTDIMYVPNKDIILVVKNNTVIFYNSLLQPLNKTLNVEDGTVAVVGDYLICKNGDLVTDKFKAYNIDTLQYIGEYSIFGTTDMITSILNDYSNNFLYVYSYKFNDSNDTSILTVFNNKLEKIAITKTIANSKEFSFPINVMNENIFLNKYTETLDEIQTNFGTMTKLAKTITKTIGQTMRITYTFQIGGQ